MADAKNLKDNLVETAKNIVESIDREREKDVVTRRFGLDGTKETLEQIGEMMGVTRERVRQIEKATLIRIKIALDGGKNPEFDAAEKEIVKVLHEMGRAGRIGDITKKLMGDNGETSRSVVTFLAELSPKMVVIADNNNFYQSIALLNGDKDVKAAAENIIAAIKKVGKPVKLDELHTIVTGFEHPSEVAAIASLSKQLASLNGTWGMVTWPTVNPRNIRDKIFVVMDQNGKPMHFADISKAIKSQDFVRNNITPQAIHNELIKDERFMLVGRGIYALDTWGFKKGTIADIIADVLRNEQPLHREEIVRRVLKERQVREATILLNLQNKPEFKRVAKAQYALDEEQLKK